MVGNHQTSIYKWLFGVPGMYLFTVEVQQVTNFYRLVVYEFHHDPNGKMVVSTKKTYILNPIGSIYGIFTYMNGFNVWFSCR